MKKTYDQLRIELVKSKRRQEKLKERIVYLRNQIKEAKEWEAELVIQYERVVRSWREDYCQLADNTWGIVYRKIIIYIDKVKDKLWIQ